jgi:type I restriction enzyme S subunit
MASEWVTKKISDLVNVTDYVANGSFASLKENVNYLEDYGYAILVRLVDFNSNWLGKFVYISEESYKFLSKTKLDVGDIIISNVGANAGTVFKVPDLKKPASLAPNAILIKTDDTSIRDYLYYYFSSHFGQGKIRSIISGSAQPKFNKTDFRNLYIEMPSSPLVRQKINYFLHYLDQKIELNRQMNTTLESMAQALFKSWFVDFDPVLDKALAAGNPIPDELQSKAAARLALGDARKALPVEIQALFPSSFVLTEEMGWIPEGWDVESMINMVNSISETYPLRKVDSVIFLNTGDILDGLVLHSTYSSTKDLPGQAKKSIKKGDILYSEIRPQNKRFSYIDFDAEDYVVSTKLMVLRAKDSYDPLFCYFILKQEETISLLQYIAETRSGTFPQITFKELENIKFALPANNKLIESFGELFLHDFFKKSSELQRNSKLLANLRDTLLPKLLSGELRIPDAENLAAEVL